MPDEDLPPQGSVLLLAATLVSDASSIESAKARCLELVRSSPFDQETKDSLTKACMGIAETFFEGRKVKGRIDRIGEMFKKIGTALDDKGKLMFVAMLLEELRKMEPSTNVSEHTTYALTNDGFNQGICFNVNKDTVDKFETAVDNVSKTLKELL